MNPNDAPLALHQTLNNEPENYTLRNYLYATYYYKAVEAAASRMAQRYGKGNFAGGTSDFSQEAHMAAMKAMVRIQWDETYNISGLLIAVAQKAILSAARKFSRFTAHALADIAKLKRLADAHEEAGKPFPSDEEIQKLLGVSAESAMSTKLAYRARYEGALSDVDVNNEPRSRELSPEKALMLKEALSMFAPDIRELLVTRMEAGGNISKVARAHNMSVPTAWRKIAEAGKKFDSLVEEILSK